MAHQRILTKTSKGGNIFPDIDYRTSKAVRAGNLVFVEGQTGLTMDGKGFVGEGDPAAQADKAMKNIKTILEAAGARMEEHLQDNRLRHGSRLSRSGLSGARPTHARCLSLLDRRGGQGARQALCRFRDRCFRGDTRRARLAVPHTSCHASSTVSDSAASSFAMMAAASAGVARKSGRASMPS